ncbi:MAG TPA: hypothetical protein VNJ71_09480 [Gemmatimonadales bacterium]|nr:hypothetical protein [Gemmatimonadales bacterium]
MTATRDRLVEEYLRRLDRALRDLPRDRRREIVQEIEEHIDQALSELGSPSEAEVRGLIDRMGDPEDIAAEARASLDLRPRRAGGLEIAALVLLAVGGLIVPFLGWVVGVVLLWVSPAWTWWEKLVGTLFTPGGLSAAFAVGVLGIGLALPAGAGALLFAFLLVAPVASVAFLAWRLRRAEPVAG